MKFYFLVIFKYLSVNKYSLNFIFEWLRNYGVNATIIIFVFVLYCIVLYL